MTARVEEKLVVCECGTAATTAAIASDQEVLDFRHVLQHPWTRLSVAYSVVVCNLLMYAEDPLAHSLVECQIPLLGDVWSLVANRYPPEWQWTAVKVAFWLSGVALALVAGKRFVHAVLLRRVLRLQMFREEEGTWLVTSVTLVLVLYVCGRAYNACLDLWPHPRPDLYHVTSATGVTYARFAKTAACGTWMGDLFTAWMVTDMMLQDWQFYPKWAPALRRLWRAHTTARLVVFWSVALAVAACGLALILTDAIVWDRIPLSRLVSSSELSRAFLAAAILVMDLLVVMQDWDFPHFSAPLDVSLPGLRRSHYTWRTVRLSGKWFNYGIIVAVMALDLNMLKNQLIYWPPDYGQYVEPRRHRVHTVTDPTVLLTGNASLWEYSARAAALNPLMNGSLADSDPSVNARYLGYPAFVKAMALLPAAAGFVLFFTLIYQYGRYPSKKQLSMAADRQASWRRRSSRVASVKCPACESDAF